MVLLRGRSRSLCASTLGVSTGKPHMSSKDPRDYAHEHAHGGMSKQAYEEDPKRLCFTLARYKHVAKMLEGMGHVLEVGCADGFGSRIVRQHVSKLTAIDADLESIRE